MANQLLNDLVKHLNFIDSIIKNVLFKMNDNNLFQIKSVQFEDLIQLKDEQTILHYTAQKLGRKMYKFHFHLILQILMRRVIQNCRKFKVI